MTNSRQELENILANLELRARKKNLVKPYLEWVIDYWSSRGAKLDFKKHKYLERIYKDQSPFIVYKKSAQVGITERMITEACWLADQFNENSIYFFPTSGTVGDLVQERIDQPIFNSKYLLEVSGRVKNENKKWADKISLKKFSKGFVYFRGSNNATQITSVSGDVIFVDELERMTQENVPYFDKRLEHSNRKWQRWASTPTIPNFGIDKLYQQSDQCELEFKCNHCGQIQRLTFWDNVDKGKKIIICNKCHNEIIPWQLGQNWVKGKDSDIRGYYINQLASPMIDVKKLISESEKSAEWEIQQFYNQNLGIAYEPKGSRITEQDLNACKRPFKQPIREDTCFAGIDVGRDFHGVIIGDKRLLKEVKTGDFNELVRQLREYEPKTIVIDALPETRKSQELANAFKGRAYLCYYLGMEQVKEGDWFKAENEKVNTNRTVSLDYSTELIKKQMIELPENISREFIEHFKSLSRVFTEGDKKAEYVRIGDDHFRHAFNYANIAREIFKKQPAIDLMIL